MELNTLWFILIGFLFTGYFFLEGFDFGVGMLLPFLGRNDEEKRIIINSIGPVWDGNEVWLIVAGGAMFAAFPEWYATLFSSFYLALVLMLVGLIFRGVAFEFRSKEEDKRWRMFWDWALAIGSAIPSLLWGVAFANIVRGIAINADGIYQGTFFDHLNIFAIAGGVFTLSLFLLHGALYLTMKVDESIASRARKVSNLIWPIVVIAGLTFLLLGASTIGGSGGGTIVAIIFCIAMLIASSILVALGRHSWAFITLGLTMLAFMVAVFTHLYPNVMISSLDPAWNMSIESSSATDYTLRIMSYVALVLVPIVIGYQAWSYWLFRKRIHKDSHLEY